MKDYLPLISVIIPIYNVEKYIVRCLSSVIHQTFKGDIECIVVDDCGIDNSFSIAKQFISEYNGNVSFRMIRHEHNRGLSAARNTGTLEATGEYIYYLDSDDELPLNALELMAAQVTSHRNIQIVQGLTYSEPMAYEYELNYFRENQYVNSNEWIRKNYYTLGKRIPVNAVNKLINKDFIFSNNLFFKEGIIHEDTHWMFYVVKYLSSLAFVFEPTYIRYYNDGTIMSTQSIEREAANMKVIVNDWLQHLDEDSYLPQLRMTLINYAKDQVYLTCSQKENDDFIIEIGKILWDRKQYKSYFFLNIWGITRHFRNVKKLLRFSCESIKEK